MQNKRLAKRLALLALMVVTAMGSGLIAAPSAQQPAEISPSAISCGDVALCNGPDAGIYVENGGTGASVYGRNTSHISGAGIYGRAQQGAGVRAQSNSGNGLFASSYNVAGVRGRSTWGAGILAESINNYGLNAQSSNDDAVHARTDEGIAIYGRSTNFWGGYLRADDNAQPDLVLGGTDSTDDDGSLWSDPAYGDSDLSLYSMDTVSVHLDENDDGESSLTLYNGADERVFRIDEAGDLSGNWATEESDTTIRCRDALAVHLNDDGSGTSGAINIYDDNDQLCLVLSDNGNIYKLCGGTSSAVVEAEDGVPRRLYVVESPEVWLEDLGTGRLDNGGAVVAIEPLFLSTINTQIPYHVFVTPLGDCKGLYVTDKTATSFAVRELSGGTSQVEFEYRIIAKRRGWEEARMEPAPVEPGGASPPDEGDQ